MLYLRIVSMCNCCHPLVFAPINIWGESLVEDDDKEKGDEDAGRNEAEGEVDAPGLVEPRESDGADHAGNAAGGCQHAHPKALWQKNKL